MPSTRTILIVDNNLGFVLWAGWELQNAGYEVLPATTIATSKKLLEEFRPNLAILMINMLLRGATCLAARLRHAHPGLRVLAIVDEDQGIENPAEGVIVRPRDLSDPETTATLVRRVQSFLPNPL
jgi:DNA-binding response OmpR family regulator